MANEKSPAYSSEETTHWIDGLLPAYGAKGSNRLFFKRAGFLRANFLLCLYIHRGSYIITLVNAEQLLLLDSLALVCAPIKSS